MSHDFPTAAATRYNSDLPEVERFNPQAEEELIARRTREWREALQPANPLLVWLVGQIAELSVRIEDCQRRHRARRDCLAQRAADCWDDDRRVEAERLGATLAADPARVSRVLQETMQGCQWMIERWETLARVLETRGNWGDEQHRLALDLLGTPQELRDAPHPFDLAGGDIAPALALLRDEVLALSRHRDYRIRGLNIVARDAEARGLNLAADKVLIQIQREEAAYRRQQQAALVRFPNLRPTRGATKAAAALVGQLPSLKSSLLAPVSKPPIIVAEQPPVTIPNGPPAPSPVRIADLAVSEPSQVDCSEVIEPSLALPGPLTQPSATKVEGLIVPSPLVVESCGGGWSIQGAGTIQEIVSPEERDVARALGHSKTAQPHAVSRAALSHGRFGATRSPLNRHERRALQRMVCRA